MRRQRLILVLSAVAVCLPVPSPAAEPTDDEQLMLEMINRMRWDPAAELHILTRINPGPPATWQTPKSPDPDVAGALTFFNVDANLLAQQWAGLTPRVAPLAWNANLADAATFHSGRMIFHDDQQHEFPGDPGLVERFESHGYTGWSNLSENIYAYSDSVFYGHAGFAIDWGFGPGGIQSPPGHRDNYMDPALKEVGINITPESDPSTEVGPLVITQDFGARFGNSFITGVLYDESSGTRDSFYTPGEGLGGVTVTALTPNTSAVRGTTTSSSSGGYALRIAPGTYDLQFTGPGLDGRTVTYRNVTIGNANVKIDNLTSFIAPSNSAWSSVNNWSAGVPDGPGTLAVLGRAVAGQPPGVRIVNVDAPVTVGQLHFVAPNAVSINGSALLTLDGGGAPARINVQPAIEPPVIRTPLAFKGQVVRDGPATLSISGPQQHQPGSQLALRQGLTGFFTNAGAPGVRNLAVIAGGVGTEARFTVSQDLAALDVTDRARVTLTPGGGKVLVTDTIFISGGTFDLTNNAAIVDYTNPDPSPLRVRDAIRSAYNNGAWNHTGITSTNAATTPGTAVGYTEAADLYNFNLDVIHTFFGRQVDETSTLTRYTLEGDANLDGDVNFADFQRLRSNLSESGDWSDGDFDYDGLVTPKDYALLRRNLARPALNPSLTAAQWATVEAFDAVVPEPGAAALILSLAAYSLRRQRRSLA